MMAYLQGLKTSNRSRQSKSPACVELGLDDDDIAQVLADMTHNLDNLDAIASGSVIQGFEQFAVDALEAADRFDELDRAASAMGTFANSGAAPGGLVYRHSLDRQRATHGFLRQHLYRR